MMRSRMWRLLLASSDAYTSRRSTMSRATTWIVVGTGMLVGAGVFAVIGYGITSTPEGATGATTGFMFVAGLIALAGLFAIQVGVVALAVKIGTHELREAVTGQPVAVTRPAPAQASPHLPGRPV